MRFSHHMLAFLCLCLFHALVGQSSYPDYVLEKFYQIDPSGSGMQARAWLYSDGQALTLVVEVEDDQVTLTQQPAYCDHVQVWLGLDETAFPERFPHHLHPQYLGALQVRSIRGAREPRGEWRVIGPTAQPLGTASPRSWVDQVGYPGADDIRADSLQVPAPEALRPLRVPFGMVQYALFPNGDPAQLMYRDQYGSLEAALDAKASSWASSIITTGEELEHRQGYMITAHIPAEALGFARLPRLDVMRVLIGVANVPAPGEPARMALSSHPDHPSRRLQAMPRVRLQRPIRVNPTNIDDQVFERLGWYPPLFFSEFGWLPVQVDADGLVWREGQISSQWQEMAFSRLELSYLDYRNQGYPIQRLLVRGNRVSALDLEYEALLLPDQVLRFTRARELLPSQGHIEDFRPFRFQDGATGIIIRDNAPLDPYGWGDCGICLQEHMHVYRLTPAGLKQVLSWEQSEGPQPYLRISDRQFDGYFLDRLDWISDRELLVLHIDHRNQRLTERIKAAWDDRQQRFLLEFNP